MFLDSDFLLKDEFTKKLYHKYAEKMPIIDYHCHLDPKEIYEDIQFKNITEAWLYGDHYKWRLMRANGVPESHITGDAPDYDKFLEWAETIENCIGNPLYVWTHLELKRIFGIEELLNSATAPMIWQQANEKLASNEMTTRELIKKFKVKVICTTDDPVSDLKFHKLLAKEEKGFKVFPTFRPDKALNIELKNYAESVKELAKVSGIPIADYNSLLDALEERMDYFHEVGCRLSDHGFGNIQYLASDAVEIEGIFQKAMHSELLTDTEVAKYKMYLFIDLMARYAKKGWTAQIHANASRNNNSQLFKTYGPDGGGDAITDGQIEQAISKIFDQLTEKSALPKTILYSLNPKDYITLTALIGCFQNGEKGKLQLGSAWWFNDTYSGMRYQLTTLAEGGILGNFVGMLTDSRSFLSYPRHEYFRRILCEVIGEWVASGQFPDDEEYVGQIVENICYNNADRYFGFL